MRKDSMKKRWRNVIWKFDSLSLRKKLNAFRSIVMLPFLILIVWMILMMISYNEKYSDVINNVAAATEFNSDFSTDLDYKMYLIVTGSATFEEEDPYQDINQAMVSLDKLKSGATTENSVEKIEAIHRLISRLRKTIENIQMDREVSGRRDQMEILDKDIYQLTELIDEKMADYIRYEAEHLNLVRAQLQADILNSITWCAAATAILIGVLLIMTNRISRSIEQPIRELCDSTKEVANGNFDIQVRTNHSMEEMEVLGNSFNSMVRRIGSLVKDVKIEQIHLRKTELKLLQAQINPHFLYNTLDTIIWLAEDEQNKQVVQMVDQLSIFFRTTLSKGQDFITIGEEESHVTSYLEIQQFRYSDILEYEVLMDQNIKNYYILKICLQPIVENALYHGLKNKRGKGKLTVRGYLDGDYLRFSVQDSGRGMTPEELKLLEGQIVGDYTSDTKSGFGLLNVNERLCLTYGEECKLRIDSQFGIGTVVSFQIPVEKAAKGVLS